MKSTVKAIAMIPGFGLGFRTLWCQVAGFSRPDTANAKEVESSLTVSPGCIC
jgi:hypothetical protein